MSIRRRARGRMIPAFVGCFYAGIAVGWLLHAAFTPREPRPGIASPPAAATSGEVRGDGRRPAPSAVEGSEVEGDNTNTAEPVRKPDEAVDVPTIGTDVLAELRHRALELPIEDANVDAMEGDFAERRGGGLRGHEAVDILAPRHTPIHAVEDGTVAKLFTSKAGGITLYQFDPSQKYCYYYAHLERYAPGVREGMRVSKGEVIGYVGTTGNAPPSTPHLHFAIYRLGADKRWWEGQPLDPYLVYRN